MAYEKEMKRGIIKRIDNLGRITVPKAWRQVLGMELNDELNIFLIDNDTIGIRIKKDSKKSTLQFAKVQGEENFLKFIKIIVDKQG